MTEGLEWWQKESFEHPGELFGVCVYKWCLCHVR